LGGWEDFARLQSQKFVGANNFFLNKLKKKSNALLEAYVTYECVGLKLKAWKMQKKI